jgi:hypothetical protein
MTNGGLIGLVVSLINGSNHRAIERQTRQIVAAMPKAPVTVCQPPTPTPRNYSQEPQVVEAEYNYAMERFRKTGDKRYLPMI